MVLPSRVIIDFGIQNSAEGIGTSASAGLVSKNKYRGFSAQIRERGPESSLVLDFVRAEIIATLHV